METIVNKVAESGLITIDLSTFIPDPASMAAFDMKPFLFMEMILREKDYREALKVHDWSAYADKHVHIHCSADAIVPMWAYMLAASYLQPVAKSIFYGFADDLRMKLLLQNIRESDLTPYAEKRVVIKGCGEEAIPAQAYVAITATLQPVVKSIMYGEPCSTVPVYKKPAGK